MSTDSKKVILVIITLAITAYYAAKAIPLIPRGDYDAAFVFSLGIVVLSIPLIAFIRLPKGNLRFRLCLGSIPTVAFLIIALIVLHNVIDERQTPDAKLERAVRLGNGPRVEKLLSSEQYTHGQLQYAMAEAVYRGNGALIPIFLKAGVQIDELLLAENESALSLAVIHKQDETLSNLITLGAKLETVNGNGMTALQLAAAERNANALRILAEAGAKVNAKNEKDGFTALHYAVQDDLADDIDLNSVRYLLDHGADVNALAKSGWTPLTLVPEDGRDELRALLIARGGRAIQFDDSGLTSLHWAAKESDIGAAKRVLDGGDVVVDCRSKGGDTPLYLALEEGNDSIVEYLLKRGADPMIGRDGCPPLVFALTQARDLRVLDVLIRAGASVLPIPTEDGSGEYNPLYSAVACDNAGAVALLVKRGAVVNGVVMAAAGKSSSALVRSRVYQAIDRPKLAGGDINTFLLLAIREEDAKGVAYALEKGANLNPGDGVAGETPLTMAAKYNNGYEIIESLLAHGADPSLTNSSNETAFEAAKGANNKALADYLAKRGFAKEKAEPKAAPEESGD
jgi:ankyrin repeat protein